MHFRAGLVDEKCTQFFITHGKPHHPISKDTLARWVKEVMVCAGIDVTTFKPHSTRGASTSKAFHLFRFLFHIFRFSFYFHFLFFALETWIAGEYGLYIFKLHMHIWLYWNVDFIFIRLILGNTTFFREDMMSLLYWFLGIV